MASTDTPSSTRHGSDLSAASASVEAGALGGDGSKTEASSDAPVTELITPAAETHESIRRGSVRAALPKLTRTARRPRGPRPPHGSAPRKPPPIARLAPA